MIKKIFLSIFSLTITLVSQPKETLSASEIKLALKKLNVLGTVLYIAAHPDDENTEFLSYFNSGKLLRTGYLSLTRGDGGQNLIGDEQGDMLGVIRTQELLQARNIDGAGQFFTRAIDFGYTKTSEETFQKWGKEEILSDVVWVIRKFKPDVIVTRFPTTGQGGHGQHTASAILAIEAFKISGDPNVFPEQLKYVETWQPKRIFWNAWTPALKSMGVDSDTLIQVNLGEFNKLLGKSYTEISARSRTMHKSQGFGDSGWRENYPNYFYQFDGSSAKQDMFAGINLSWSRIKGSEKVAELISKAEKELDDENPSKIIPLLIEAYKELQKLEDKYWKEVKGKEILELIRSCAGIWIEAVTDEQMITYGSNIKVTAGIVNRSDVPFTIRDIKLDYQIKDSVLNTMLTNGVMVKVNRTITIPNSMEYTHPYWLNGKRKKDIYNVDDQILIGLPQKDDPVFATFVLDYKGNSFELKTPVYFRTNDKVEGEIYRTLEIIPAVVVNFNKSLYLINGAGNEIRVTVKSMKDNIKAKLKLINEDGWEIKPKQYVLELSKKNDEQIFTFSVEHEGTSSSSIIKALVESDDKEFNKSLITIRHSHIQPQIILPDAEAKIVKMNGSKKVVNKICYIMGSGDMIPEYLSELGYKVDVINIEPITSEMLDQYDVVITGIRAYNTNQRLALDQEKLLEYVSKGGTLIVQYNTQNDMLTTPGPYELKISRDRITEEDSPVKILIEEHPLFNFPNKITLKDFDGWIQERGLYYPNEWDSKYEPMLEMNDTGELPKQGALLYTKYGKGVFIYTGLSFFRQLPAGVEGAYKLFINMISAGKYAEQ